MIWKWKKSLKIDENVDALNETCIWKETTIIKIYEERDGDKIYPMTIIGFKRFNYVFNDDLDYEEQEERFDVKIPLYSPRIAAF